MGSGIAQVSAQAGHTVKVMDMTEDLVKKSISIIDKSMGRLVQKKYENDADGGKQYKDEIMQRITTTTDIKNCVENADFIVEAIVEKLEVKQKVFKELDVYAPAKTIFASNTSSLPIADIASVTGRKDRFAGIHFFNPVPMMKLVEVIKTKESSSETIQLLTDFAKSLSKVPITCSDTPGFVVNRLLVPYLMESIRLFENGVASKEDIDTGMKLGAGYPMGPFELADFVGLDTLKFIIDGWAKASPSVQAFQSSKLLDKLVSEGKNGKKTGEGFYKYDKK